MSIIACDVCATLIDTDEDHECSLLSSPPDHYSFHCKWCRETLAPDLDITDETLV